MTRTLISPKTLLVSFFLMTTALITNGQSSIIDGIEAIDCLYSPPNNGPQKAIDGNTTTYFDADPRSCYLNINITLTKTIRAAKVTIISNLKGIDVLIPYGNNRQYYHTSMKPTDVFYIIAPEGIGLIQFKAVSAQFFKIYEIQVEEISIGTASADFYYDAAGNMTKHSIVLSVSKQNAMDSVGVTLPDQEFSEELTPYEETILRNTILVFPNPTKGELRVEIDMEGFTETGHALINLHSLSGTLVQERIHTSQNTTLNLREQPAGIYILTVRVGDQLRTWRVVKQ